MEVHTKPPEPPGRNSGNFLSASFNMGNQLAGKSLDRVMNAADAVGDAALASVAGLASQLAGPDLFLVDGWLYRTPCFKSVARELEPRTSLHLACCCCRSSTFPFWGRAANR